MVKWAVNGIIYAAFAAAIVFLWRQNQQMKKKLQNYQGTNAALSTELTKVKEEKTTFQIEIQKLEHDNAELVEINRILHETLDRVGGKTEEGLVK